MRNCPNCGAVIDPYQVRCGYCGTYYFDFTAFDMTEDTPYYVKFKGSYGIITTLAKPSLEAVEVTSESKDITDKFGNVIMQMPAKKDCDLYVRFRCIPDANKTLYQLETLEGE